MEHKVRTKALSWLLTLAMLVGLLPMQVLAYTVEFTRGELQYVMQGDSEVPLADVLETVGLSGTVTAVEVSDSTLFSASKKDGEWVVTTHQAFSTEEWMRVTIDGVVYEIVVTDGHQHYVDDNYTLPTEITGTSGSLVKNKLNILYYRDGSYVGKTQLDPSKTASDAYYYYYNSIKSQIENTTWVKTEKYTYEVRYYFNVVNDFPYAKKEYTKLNYSTYKMDSWEAYSDTNASYSDNDGYGYEKNQYNVMTVNLSKPAATAPTLTGWSGTYDGQAHSVTATGASGGTVYFQTSEDNSTWNAETTTVPSRTAVGTTYVKAYTKGDSNHKNSNVVTAKIIINAMSMDGVSASGYSGTYDGAAHGITVTAPEGATVKYRESDSGDYNLASSPTYTDVGTHTVYYQVTKENYTTVTGSETVAIAQKEVGLEWGSTNFTYDGQSHAPTVTATDLISGDTCTVTADGAQTNAGGPYTATADSLSNSNYKLPSAKTTSFTISKLPITITAADQTVERGGSVASTTDKVSVTSGALVSGHSITAVTLGGDTSAVTQNGTVTFTAATIKDGDGSGTDVTGNYEITYATGKLTVTKTAPTYTAPEKKNGLVYNKTAQELVNAGTVTGGEFYYRVGDSGTWSKELPKATNAGSYAIYYYVKGDSDHSDVGSEASPISLGVVTIAQKEVTLSWTNIAFAYDGEAHIPTATATGVIDGDTCTVTVTGAKADMGTHTATATGLSNTNYKLPDAKTHTFTISGAEIVYGDDSAVTAPKRGETLKAVLVPTDTGLTYQWYCGDTPIDSATGETYTLTDGDVGKYIKVIIKKGETSYPSAPVGPVAQVYAVEGIVVKSDGTTLVSGINVKLMQGNTSFGQDTTDTDGKFIINNVPKGSYNLVASGDVDGTQLTKTQILELSADVTDVKVIMPAGKTESVLDNDNAGDFAAVVDGLDDRAAEETPGSGEKITIQMTITSEGNVGTEARLTDGDKTAFATGKTAIEALPAASGKTMEYMNIKLDETSSTNASVHTDIGDINTKVMKIIMQYDFTGRYSVTVFRYHGTTAVALTKGSGADGTFETNETAGTITIYASKFSTYAIGYSTTPPAPVTPPATPIYGGGGWTPATLPTRYPVETEQTEHGTTEASHKEATAGTKVIITPKPDKSYEAASATVRDKDGKLVSVTKEKDGTWSFTMPASKVTVSVSYAKTVITPADTGVADWLITDDHIVYLNGYDEDGIQLIGPDRNITRAEVAMIFYRLLKNKDVTVTKSYSDVPDFEWFVQAVGVLSSLGILNGYDEGDFRPQNPITRAEFTAIATRFAKATGGTSDFFDVPGDHWAYGNIATASDYGWVTGDNGLFRPEDKITRAEVAAIVNRMLGRKADQEWVLANPDKIRYFSDLQDTKQWYYFDMIEASNEHDFTKDDGVEKWK